MSVANPLLERIERFAGRTILVLGDVMLDAYVYGHVERVSPEAPIPVLRIDSKREMLGGAGNVARNVAALGARAILVGVAGRDDAGRAIEAQLAEAGQGRIDGRIIIDAARPTTRKTRYVSGSQQMLRVDEEVALPVLGTAADAVLARFREALAECDIVVLSDYSKGVLSDAVLAPAIAAAHAAGKRVIADPKSRDFTRYRHVDILKPNRLEITQATGIDCLDDAATERAGRAALGLAEAGAVIVTRGAHGVSIVPKDGPALHLPTLARAVFDVSGAGDTLVVLPGRGTGRRRRPGRGDGTGQCRGRHRRRQGRARQCVTPRRAVARPASGRADRDRPQGGDAERRARPGRALAGCGPARRLHQRLLRPDPPGPCPPAGPGARRLRPADRRPQHRRLGEAAQGAGPADPERGRACHGDGLDRDRRPGRPVRRRHAARA